MIDQTDVQDSFAKSQRRYVDYYCKIASTSKNLPRNEVEAELSNLQSTLFVVLNDQDTARACEFWETISDFLWYRCYWQSYFDWGNRILTLLSDTRTNRRAQAWLMSELGWLHLEWADYRVAQELFHKSREVFYLLQEQKGICVVERYLGVLAYRKRELDVAARQYKIAEGIARENDYELILSEIFNLQGSLARKLGELEKARDLYSASGALAQRLGDQWRSTAALRNLAQLEAELGHFEAAKSAFEHTIELCAQVDRKDMLYSCQLKLAEVEQKLDNTPRAKELALAARDGFVYLNMQQSVELANSLLSSFVASNLPSKL